MALWRITHEELPTVYAYSLFMARSVTHRTIASALTCSAMTKLAELPRAMFMISRMYNILYHVQEDHAIIFQRHISWFAMDMFELYCKVHFFAEYEHSESARKVDPQALCAYISALTSASFLGIEEFKRCIHILVNCYSTTVHLDWIGIMLELGPLLDAPSLLSCMNSIIARRHLLRASGVGRDRLDDEPLIRLLSRLILKSNLSDLTDPAIIIAMKKPYISLSTSEADLRLHDTVSLYRQENGIVVAEGEDDGYYLGIELSLPRHTWQFPVFDCRDAPISPERRQKHTRTIPIEHLEFIQRWWHESALEESRISVSIV